MSTVSNPYGFRPIFHPSGIIRPFALKNGITSGYGTALYTGQPVILDTNGTLTVGTVTNDLFGIFAGVQYTPTGGRPTYSPSWPAAATFDSSEDMICYYYNDPQLLYAVQADGSLAATSVGSQCDFTNTTANGSGYSQCTLSATPETAGQQGQFRVIELFSAPNNDWGDTYTQVVVQIAQLQYVANKVSI